MSQPDNRKPYDRRLPVTRTSQSLPVFEASKKIGAMAEVMGVAPNPTAFAKHLGLRVSTLRDALSKEAFTTELLEALEEALKEHEYKFSIKWPEWRDTDFDLQNGSERADTALLFIAKFRRENRSASAVADSAATSDAKQPSLLSGIARGAWSLDLWTPRQSADAIMHHLGGSLGPDEAQVLLALSKEAIAAIGRSDFSRQHEIADETIAIGKAAPETPLLGEGLYLKAEALRLLADFEPNFDEQRRLRAAAAEYYGRAEQELRGDPRAIRGRARVLESMGDLSAGMQGFQRAHATLEVLNLDRHEANQLSLTHESIRTLRHRILCLATIHAQSSPSTLEAAARAEELRRLIASSESKHRRELHLFKGEADNWLGIEWFTSLVLHARAWSALGERAAAARRLCWSLEARFRIIPKTGPSTAVELGNLHWWSLAVLNVQNSFDVAQQAPLANLLDLIRCGADRPALHRASAEFLLAGAAPWA